MSDRPTIILLPGNMCDGRLWEAGDRLLLDALEAKGWQVSRPALDADSIAAMAAGVLAAHDGPIIPMGFSMGGIVALEIARQAPERLAGLILLDTNASADLPDRAAKRPGHQAKARDGRLKEILAVDLMPHYLAAENEGDEALKALIVDMGLTLGVDVFVRQSEALRTRADLSGIVPAFGGPLFLACGAEDRLCYPEWHMAMAAQAKQGDLHIIPGAGHMLPLEQPAALAQALTGWLDRSFA